VFSAYTSKKDFDTVNNYGKRLNLQIGTCFLYICIFLKNIFLSSPEGWEPYRFEELQFIRCS